MLQAGMRSSLARWSSGCAQPCVVDSSFVGALGCVNKLLSTAQAVAVEKVASPPPSAAAGAAAAASRSAPKSSQQQSTGHRGPEGARHGPGGGGSGSSGWGPSLLGGTVAFAVATFGGTFVRGPLHAEARKDEPSGAATAAAAAAAAAEVEELQAWLEGRGSEVQGVRVAPAAGAAGLGVFSTGGTVPGFQPGWLGSTWERISGAARPRAVAVLPAEIAITAASVTSGGSAAARGIREMLGQGLLDEHTAVMAHLALERRKGKASELAPYIAALPASFSTSLFFSDQEMEALKGTSLHAATKGKQMQLQALWRLLEPRLRDISRAEGIREPPTDDDFLWAFTVWWSRALNLPLPSPEAPPGSVEMQVGLVPGLDFCNHRGSAANAVHSVLKRPLKGAQEGSSGYVIALALKGRRFLKDGLEVTIDYGDKCNEELLFHYGFTEPDNPHDMLMVPCPVPPRNEWDEVLTKRMALLAARGLSPQFFLPRPDDVTGPSSGRGHQSESLPNEVWGILEVFVMSKGRLNEELKAAAADLEGGSGSDGAAPAEKETDWKPKDAGQQMAVLSTFVKLMEYQVLELEGGERGTGPLEQDLRLLEQLEVDSGRPGAEPSRMLDALRYRAAQKQIAREYLGRGRAALQQVMGALAMAA